MASPGLKSNPCSKRLNPHATPFIKPLSPTKIELVLPLKHFLLHNHSQAAAQPMPLVAHGGICSPDCVPTPAWEYSAPATMVYYNSNKQPFVANTMPFYAGHVDRSVSYNTNAQPVAANPSSYYSIIEHQKGFADAIMEETVKGMRDFGFFGCGEKRAENRYSPRHLASRMSSKKRDSRDFCAERLWVPKKPSLDNKSGGAGIGSKLDEKVDGGDGVLSSSLSDNEIELDGKTSLMIRNIPNQLGRHDLLRILDKHCLEENRKAKLQSDPLKSEYDFLYLPMDFRNRANYGYAFVNFTSVVAASRFCKSFHKYKWEVSVNKKTCEISCAVIQGKEALKNQFKNSIFHCHTNGYLPVVLSPPRDGLVRSKPILVGRRGVGALPPIRADGQPKEALNK
ncbi:hypothetical protein P3X46_028626 [Hevea brasiliensis]|uniref:Mei2-like C-terminal RNA recognition motif domain-containing protein n=2 Tax=Hevea brasiliensis TaxID=3981 RepID=A0ABQ9KR37_HEVBR|nr:hypothetical protein P3X46_028626 [Hevea brasiliensis]